ncbi:MAG: hypothetical protein HQ596_04290 [Candidatus Saganbacteria bacterium]|nr:hypothetical protein [Candidatus Saganbacteria bacterium]
MEYLVPNLLDLGSVRSTRGSCADGSGAAVDGGGGGTADQSLCSSGGSPSTAGGGGNSCVDGGGNDRAWYDYNCIDGSDVGYGGCSVGSQAQTRAELAACEAGSGAS